MDSLLEQSQAPNISTSTSVVLSSLLELKNDKNNVTFEAMKAALKKIATKHPNDVVTACCNFLKQEQQNTKANFNDSVLILEITEDICKEHAINLNTDIVLILIEVCMELMTRSPNNLHVESPIQMAAGSTLVALGSKHGIQVLNVLTCKISSNLAPHYTIPHALGSMASANVYEVVPKLKSILQLMLPLANSLKQDVVKQSFAYAFGKFCEAILEYSANPDQIPDESITVKDFNADMNTIFEILFGTWLNSKDTKLVKCVLDSLEPLFKILGEDKLRQCCTKCLQTFLSFLKKHKETHAVTKCIGSLILVTVSLDGTLLEPQLHLLLPALSELICMSLEYAQEENDLMIAHFERQRAHFEALRCFECLCIHYTDTLEHVLFLLKHNGEKEKCRGLNILIHLANSTEVPIKSRKTDIFNALEQLLNDQQSIKVKYTLMKCIVAFAYKGFLEKDPLTKKFINFLVKLCCRPSSTQFGDQEDTKYPSADNMLYLMSTSVEELEPILMETLLECFLNSEYLNATNVLLKCLTHLCAKNPPQNVLEPFVRCLGLLAFPTGITNFFDISKCTLIINFLLSIPLKDSTEFKIFWENKLKECLKFLEVDCNNFDVLKWEELIFEFVASILSLVKSKQFEENLISNISDQLPLYTTTSPNGTSKSHQKRFLLKILANISCCLDDKDLIAQIMNIILFNVKLNDINELESCAEAIGQASKSNLKAVLEKLTTIRKETLLKKNNNKFFSMSFMKGQKNDLEMERIRFVIIASYYNICKVATCDSHLFQVIENEILEFAISELQNSKIDQNMKKACLKTVGSAAEALNSDKNKLHVRLKERNKILDNVCAEFQLHSGPEYIELFPIIIPVITSLIQLPDLLDSQQMLKIVKLSFDNIFNASAIYCKFNENHGDVKLSPFVFATFPKLKTMLEVIIKQNGSQEIFGEIFGLLTPWLGRSKIEQRLPSLEVLQTTLHAFLENLQFLYEGPSTLCLTGHILGKVIPRCTDPDKRIRVIAVNCVVLTLSISGRYEGHSKDNDNMINRTLSHVLEQIDTEDPKLLFNLITDLANVTSSNIPKHHIGELADSLVDGLVDVEPSSSSGAAVTLNAIVKLKGNELLPNLNEILEKVLITLSKIKCTRTKSTAVLTVLSFGRHHVKHVVNFFLQQDLPYNQSVCNCWFVLANDSEISRKTIEHLLSILKQELNQTVQTPNLKLLECLHAFREVLKSSESTETCSLLFSELFSLFYIALVASISDALSPNTSPVASDKNSSSQFDVCKESFSMFLQVTNCKMSASKVLACQNSFQSFFDFVQELTQKLCLESSESIERIITLLSQYTRSESKVQRAAVVGIFTYFLKFKSGDFDAVTAENILEMFLEMHDDPSSNVKQICQKGLRFSIEFSNVDIVLRYHSGILNAIMRGLEYKNSSKPFVSLQAMLTFSKLLVTLNEANSLGPALVTAAVRIKPLLQHDLPQIREAAFDLFGNLAVSAEQDEAFLEQIHGNFITVLLHLCDVDENVVKACKRTLKKVGPFLNCPKVNAMIQEHLVDEANLQSKKFFVDLIKIMGESMQEHFFQFIMMCLNFFKSKWPDVRSYSALLSGLMYSQMNEELRSTIAINTLTYRLMQLLQDEKVEVRAKAIEALAYILIV